MVRAGRMFNDVLDNDQSVAEHAMQEIQKLYTIERNCKEQNLSFEAIKAMRHEQGDGILYFIGMNYLPRIFQLILLPFFEVRPITIVFYNRYVISGSFQNGPDNRNALLESFCERTTTIFIIVFLPLLVLH